MNIYLARFSWSAYRLLLSVVLLSVCGTLSPCYGASSLFGDLYPVSEINTPPTGDFSPSLSANGLELYFMGYQRAGNFGFSDIWVAKRDSTSEPFGEPVNLGPTFNSRGSDSNPDLSGDGLTLFFDSSRIGGGIGGDRDIWMSTRSSLDASWEAPVNLGPTINTNGWEGRPSVSADGLVLAFDTLHDRAGLSLSVATRSSTDEPFGAPTLLDDRFLHGSSPGLSADGLSLFFARLEGNPIGDLLFDTSKLWVATRDRRNDTFGDPVPLGGVINSHGDVVDPDPSLNGEQMFVVRSSLSSVNGFLSKADIYAATIVPEPSTLGMGAVAIIGVFGCRRRHIPAP